MGTSSPNTRQLQGRLGAEIRHRPQSDHTDIHRALSASRIADYVSRVVAESGPLTADQADTIAALLRPDSTA